MLTRDFDAEFAADAPAEFTLCGQIFHAKAHVPYAVWRSLLRGDRQPSDDTPPEKVDQILFEPLLDEDDFERFMAVVNSENGDSPTRAQMLALYAWLLDVGSGKAPASEETSSDG